MSDIYEFYFIIARLGVIILINVGVEQYTIECRCVIKCCITLKILKILIVHFLNDECDISYFIFMVLGCVTSIEEVPFSHIGTSVPSQVSYKLILK